MTNQPKTYSRFSCGHARSIDRDQMSGRALLRRRHQRIATVGSEAIGLREPQLLTHHDAHITLIADQSVRVLRSTDIHQPQMPKASAATNGPGSQSHIVKDTGSAMALAPA